MKLVVLDMAGTTVDEQNVVYKTLMKALNEHGYNFPLETVLEHGAGKEKLQAIKDLMAQQPDVQQAPSDTIYTRFKAILSQAYTELDVAGQPGSEAVFQQCREKGIKVVLNTGYNKATAETLLRKLNWTVGEDIDMLITADDVDTSRPHPAMIHLAMKTFNISDARQVAKVGDSIIDIEEGKNAKCGLTVGVTTGAHTEAQLKSADPDYVIHRLDAMMDLI